MLDHPIAVRSWPGRGSVFSVSVQLAAAPPLVTPQAPLLRSRNSVSGKQVLCMDNEPSVLAAMRTSRGSVVWGGHGFGRDRSPSQIA